MAGDCKIGSIERNKVKVGKDNGLGRGLHWEAGMAYQLNLQTPAYEK